MTQQTVSYSKYLQTGSVMIILCSIFMIIYVDYFDDQVKYFDAYKKDTCVIDSINQFDISFNCWQDSGFVVVTSIPCVRIMVNTSTQSNVIFYRNIIEKNFALNNDRNCSYIPTACVNDASYMASYLQNNYMLLFPTPTFPFDCYVLKDMSKNVTGYLSDAILFLPDAFAYYTSVVVISVGFFLGALVIIYGLLNLNISLSAPKYSGVLNEVNSKGHDENFYKYVQKVLEGAHINPESVMDDDMDIEIDGENANTTNSTANRKSPTSEIVEDNKSNNKLDKIISTDKIRSKANKLKVGDTEMHIGRIDYKKPSGAKLSRHGSTRSDTSDDDSNNRQPAYEFTPNFFIQNEGYDNNIHDAILEEDERYMTINSQKNPNFQINTISYPQSRSY